MKQTPRYLIDALTERDHQIQRLEGTLLLYEGRESDPAHKKIIETRRKALDRAFSAVDEAQERYRKENL